MKIIDLLNKIANGEEVPEKIIFLGNTYRYDEIDKTYRNIIGNTNIGEMHNLEFYLDEEVEIIEESQPTEEEINEYTNKFLEIWEPISKQFGELFDELIRIKNDLGLNLEENTKEPQEHKIPEKLNLDTDELRGKEVVRSIDYLIEDKINEIIDYLEEIE